MNNIEFKRARDKLGLTQDGLAHILGTTGNTVARWEANPESAKNARDPNPIACRVLQWMLDGWRPPEWYEVKGVETLK